MVATSIPPITVVPIEYRLAAPASEAMAKGTTPKIKANAVIKIGRNRKQAASMAASRMEAPAACLSFANSTIKIAFLAAKSLAFNC